MRGRSEVCVRDLSISEAGGREEVAYKSRRYAFLHTLDQATNKMIKHIFILMFVSPFLLCGR